MTTAHVSKAKARRKEKKQMVRAHRLFDEMGKAHEAIRRKFSDDPVRLNKELLSASCVVAQKHMRSERDRITRHFTRKNGN